MFIIYIYSDEYHIHIYMYSYIYMMGVVGVTGYTNHSRFPRSVVFSTFAEFTARATAWMSGDPNEEMPLGRSWRHRQSCPRPQLKRRHGNHGIHHLKMRIQWARSLKIVQNFHWPWCGENFWRWVNHWVDLTLFPLHHPPKGFLLSFFIILTEMDQRSIDVSQPRYYELISGQIMILNKS